MAEKVLNIAAWDTGQRHFSAGIRANQPGSSVGMPIRLAWQTLGARKSCSDRWENDLWQQKQKPQSLHVVSAFAAENQLVLGELVVEEKSNEITAVPELLEALNVAGSIVTADAMSCQKAIVQKIYMGKADYVIGLKGNQPVLFELDVIFEEDSSRAQKDMFPLNLNVLRKTALALCKHADFDRRVSM